jgi:Tol biopolymer transport system component
MLRRLAAVAALLGAGCGDPFMSPPSTTNTDVPGSESPGSSLTSDHGTGIPWSIAFTSNRAGNNEIYTMQPGGTDEPGEAAPRRLTVNPGNDGGAHWSPNGREIAFHSARSGAGHSNLEIYVMNDDGGAQTRLTFTTTQNMFPAWSPDGRRIAFSRGVPADLPNNNLGSRQIWVMNADGTGARQLTSVGDNYRPRWSPDGKELVFASNRDAAPSQAAAIDLSFGIYDIYVIEVDGGAPIRRLTFLPTTLDAEAEWSPNGKQIAFRSRREVDANGDHYCAIFVMNSDGSEARNLTPIPPGATFASWCNAFPAWSRNGRQIFFHALRTTADLGLQLELYRIDADGTGEERLTFHSAGELFPAIR